MTNIFHVEELDLADQPEGTKQVWYVKEGTFIHTTCNSEEAARLSLKHFEDVRKSNAALGTIKIKQRAVAAKEHEYLAQSELAIKAIEKLNSSLDSKNKNDSGGSKPHKHRNRI
jgi:hypothetical protein